jgi:hypothetical protein
VTIDPARSRSRLLLLTRGAGVLSLDYLIDRYAVRRTPEVMKIGA